MRLYYLNKLPLVGRGKKYNVAFCRRKMLNWLLNRLVHQQNHVSLFSKIFLLL